MHFHLMQDMASDARSPVCQRYAVISEGEGRRVVVCGGDAREKTVYISMSNSITIQVYNSRVSRESAQFLLKYQGENHSLLCNNYEC